MTASAKRTRRKLLLALLSALLVASGLVYALPDSTPAAEVHDLTHTETFPCTTVQTPYGPYERCPPPKVHVVSHYHCWNGKVIAFGIGSCPPRPTPTPTPTPGTPRDCAIPGEVQGSPTSVWLNKRVSKWR